MFDIRTIVGFTWDDKHYVVDKKAQAQELPVKLPDGRFISLGHAFTLSCPQAARNPCLIPEEKLIVPFEFISAVEVTSVGRPVTA